ncbi:hypothetical protein TKK_0006605 [Trichogramma kaykai]|uniref:La-related protein 7 n=1 Tax=Trichogramma kaykai TaxID=54128 RepID=A0ABD2XD95_9HYME
MTTEDSNVKKESPSENVQEPQDQTLEDQSMQTEENGTEEVTKTRKKSRRRTKAFNLNILKQMEFYFSDSNLSKDRYLAELIKQSPDVDIKEFLKFNKIKALTTEPAKIASALKKSEILKVSEDGTKVRRITPINERNNVDDCTIYVQKLPPEADHDWVVKAFSEFGKVVYVSIPKFKPKKKFREQDPECMKHQKIKGFAFIEFETPEGVDKCIEKFKANNALLPTEVSHDKVSSITTHEDYNPDNQQSTEQAAESETPATKQEKNIIAPALIKSTETKVDDNIEQSTETKAPEKKKRKSKSLSDVNDSTEVKNNENHEKTSEKKLTERKRKSAQEIDEPAKKLKRSESCPKNKESSITSDSLAENEENKVKRSRKRSLLGGVPTSETETHQKKKKKNNDDENEEKEVFSEENDVDVKEKTSKKKKQKNKRIRVGKDQPPALPSNEDKLQVMRKTDWKKLRNKYLSLQRQQMRKLKQDIRKSEFYSKTSYNPNFSLETEKANFCSPIKETKVPDRLKFTPGVIVKMQLNETDDPKILKDIYRGPDNPNIKYVDASEDAKEIFLRFDSAESAQSLAEASEQRKCTVLTGSDEKEYWDKILQDRTQRFNKKDRPKIRGRQKLLKKAEKFREQIAKHKKFNDEYLLNISK